MMYHLEIITDGEDPKNTFVKIEGKLFKSIQYLSFEADIDEAITLCNIAFVPISIFEYDPSTELRMKSLKNKLEILSNGTPGNTIIKLNDKILNLKSFSMEVNLKSININAQPMNCDHEGLNLKFKDLKNIK